MLTTLDIDEVNFRDLPIQSQIDIQNALDAYTGMLPSRKLLKKKILKIKLLDPREVIQAQPQILTPYMPKVRRFQKLIKQGVELPPIVINTLATDAEGSSAILYEGRHRLVASAEESLPIWTIDVAQLIE